MSFFSGDRSPEWPLDIVDNFIDAFFGIDLILNFFTGYNDGPSVVVYAPNSCARLACSERARIVPPPCATHGRTRWPREALDVLAPAAML